MNDPYVASNTYKYCKGYGALLSFTYEWFRFDGVRYYGLIRYFLRFKLRRLADIFAILIILHDKDADIVTRYGRIISFLSYIYQEDIIMSVDNGDLKDFVVQALGQDLAARRKAEGISRKILYPGHYTEQGFETLQEEREELCPDWNDPSLLYWECVGR